MSDNNVLLIFSTTFSASRISSLQSSIKKFLEEGGIACREIFRDGSLLIADVDDPVRAASLVANLFGVEKVAVARRAGSRFDELVDAIVRVGKNIINDGETFAVKVVSTKSEYVGRDVEFAATAGLMAELSKLNVKTASEDLCNRLVYAYVAERSAYVCIFTDSGPGGLPPESQGEEVLCGLHDSISVLACLMMVKCGFRPRIVLLRTDEASFRKTLRDLELVAGHLGTGKMRVHIANLALEDGPARPFLMEKASSMILAELSTVQGVSNIALPLSASVFPAWLVSDIMRELSKTAMPWLPLMLMSDELYRIGSSVGLENSVAEDVAKVEHASKTIRDARDYLRLVERHDLPAIVERAVRNLQTMDAEVGPKLMHDIMDAVTA